MTSGQVTAARTSVRRRQDITCGEHELRARITSAYERAYGRTPQPRTVDALVAFSTWLARCYRHDGRVVKRSWHQIVRGLAHAGLPWTPSATIRATRQRYRNNAANRLDYLTHMGWIEGWEPVYADNGEGEGILIRVAADVAQLARAPRRARGEHVSVATDVSSASPPRRSSISTALASPSGASERRRKHQRGRQAVPPSGPRHARVERLVDDLVAGLMAGEGPVKAAAVDGKDGLGERAPLAAPLSARADRLRSELVAVAGKRDAEAELLVEAYEALFGRTARYSPERWEGRLFAALDALDRDLGRAGAGAAARLDASEATALAIVLDMAGPLPVLPESFALFVPHAEFLARMARPAARRRRRIERAERACQKLDVPLELFHEQLALEKDRAEEGRWCRVRLALKRTIEKVNTERIVNGKAPIAHGLYGAENPRWRRDWRNW
jgi:hypothetical protein